MTSSCQWRYWL